MKSVKLPVTNNINCKKYFTLAREEGAGWVQPVENLTMVEGSGQGPWDTGMPLEHARRQGVGRRPASAEGWVAEWRNLHSCCRVRRLPHCSKKVSCATITMFNIHLKLVTWKLVIQIRSCDHTLKLPYKMLLHRGNLITEGLDRFNLLTF